MEKTAIAFVNQVSKTPYRNDDVSEFLSKLTSLQAQEFLNYAGDQIRDKENVNKKDVPTDSAIHFMDPKVASVKRNSTVGQTIEVVRKIGNANDIDTVYVVDEDGKYNGHVLIRKLLTQPEEANVDSLTNTKSFFVRPDTHKDEVKNIFSKHDLYNMPVLDYEDRLVGQVVRNGNGDTK
jgi:Mg/Co/Ni transporter MgtE